MKCFSKLKFDPHKGRIYFDGGCDEVRDVCDAMCCRIFKVDLLEEEYKSGLYKCGAVCCFNWQACADPRSVCANRKYLLGRKEDGACVYLDSSNKCSIYDQRPKICRDFNCDAGWQIHEPVWPEGHEKVVSDAMKAGLKKDIKFSLNPGAAVKTIFYSAARQEAVFVMDPPARCGYMPVKHVFFCPGISDEILLFVYRSFDGNRDLGEIYKSVTAKFGRDLTEDAFFDVITLFFRQGLIILRHSAKADRETEDRHA